MNMAAGSSLMANLMGLLRIRIKRGVNLAVRDLNTSDPYIVVRMGRQVCFYSFVILSFYFIFLNEVVAYEFC